jgi:hypothetical protein
MRRINAVAIAGLVVATIATTTTGKASSSQPRFADVYPTQAAATYDPNDRGTNFWALLIGINDYESPTRDNIGSRQDARDLRQHLFDYRWRPDHIAIISDRYATRSMIIQGIRWLASKTNEQSVVIFHYSGHQNYRRTSSDGDNESRDQMIRAHDNRYILDGILGRELNRVRAARMWINMAVCRAAGFDDPGMVKTGRVLTYSSYESELSYEDPAVRYTVHGWYLVIEAMHQGAGDMNGDGQVTVEEAFRYAKPRILSRTKGRQHAVMIDKLSGSFYIPAPLPPPPPPPPPPPSRNCTLIICTGAAARQA